MGNYCHANVSSVACKDREFCMWFDCQLEMVNNFNYDEAKSIEIQQVVKLVLDIGILDDSEHVDDRWNANLKDVLFFCNKNRVCPSRKTAQRLYSFLYAQHQLFRNPGEAINEDTRKKKLHLFKFDLTKPVSQCRNNNKKVVDDDFLNSSDKNDKEDIRQRKLLKKKFWSIPKMEDVKSM